MTAGVCVALIGTLGQAVRRAEDTVVASAEKMGVDHRRANVVVAEQLADRTNIVAVGQQAPRREMRSIDHVSSPKLDSQAFGKQD